ncbi:NnrU family protein [Tropicimonas sp. S265A]|uniref:NnrU family protein n=1 Tax=Tropicimonas sp. S265A TaxID=3415134 RepID=UPI003C7B4AC8
MGWIEFALALALFLFSHAVPVRAPVRPWLVARVGTQGFTILYSALSVGVLAWLIIAAGRAPYVPVWAWAPWQNWVAIAVMLAVCLIVALTLGRPNPFSFGGPTTGFDPAQAGLIRYVRHPLLWALALWAACHGLANGSLAHAGMFIGFVAFAMLGMRMIDRRRQRAMGREWSELRARTRAERGPLVLWARDRVRLLAGAVVWAVLLLGHGAVIGPTPWP